MASYHLSPIFNGWQGFGNTGVPLNGGLLYSYLAGTTTPVATYTSTGGIANPNPIVLSSSGRPANEIWLFEGIAYKFVLQDSLGNPLGTFDNIVGIHDFIAGTPGVVFGGVVTFNNGVIMDGPYLLFNAAGQRFEADFSNATVANRLIFQTSTANGNTDLCAMPNGIATQSSANFFNGTDTANSAYVRMAISNAQAAIQSTQIGAGALLPLTFAVGNGGTPGEAMRISTTNNQLLLATTAESAVTGAKLRVNGIAQIDNVCMVAVTRGGVNQAPIATATFTKVQLTTKRTDQNSNFDNVTNYRWTPPAGSYFLIGNAQYTGLTAAGRTASIIYKNGAALFSNNVSGTIGNASGTIVGGPDIANGTDYYELWTWHNTGGNETISGLTQDTFFGAVRVG